MKPHNTAFFKKEIISLLFLGFHPNCLIGYNQSDIIGNKPSRYATLK